MRTHRPVLTICWVNEPASTVSTQHFLWTCLTALVLPRAGTINRSLAPEERITFSTAIKLIHSFFGSIRDGLEPAVGCGAASVLKH